MWQESQAEGMGWNRRAAGLDQVSLHNGDNPQDPRYIATEPGVGYRFLSDSG